MIVDDLGVVLYTSTKGHFGYTDCYKHTVNRLVEVFPHCWESLTKVAHIKRSPDDSSEVFLEMFDFLKSNGFDVLVTNGDWGHNKPSHAVGYYQDMKRTLGHAPLHKKRYVFACEDDWLLNFKVNSTSSIMKAIEFMDTNLDVLCVRVNHDVHTDLSKTVGPIKDLFYLQHLDYTPYGPTFTFQPTIVRLKEWYHSVRLILKKRDVWRKEFNTEYFSYNHCELVSGETLKVFSDSELPFAFFDPNVIVAQHIGENEWINRQIQKPS